MITEDDLRALLADDEVPAGISPAAARQRAGVVRRRRRVGRGLIGLVLVLLVPSAVLGARHLTAGARTSLPYAFGSDGTPLPAQADGWVPLKVPGLFMYDDAGALCFGPRYVPSARPGTPEYDLPGECMVEGANDSGPGFTVGDGVIASITIQPVVRADFIDGDTVVHAQVAGLRRFPSWRTLTAKWPLPAGDKDNILVRGWDAHGKLILSLGCPGGCPMVAVPSQPAVAPEPGDTAGPAATSSPAG